MRRLWNVVTAVGFAFGAAGCGYLRDRGNDALDMLDVGVSWSKRPYLSVYACAIGVASAGAGHLEGKFAGIGGGHLGTTSHYHRVLGLALWS